MKGNLPAKEPPDERQVPARLSRSQVFVRRLSIRQFPHLEFRASGSTSHIRHGGTLQRSPYPFETHAVVELGRQADALLFKEPRIA